MSFKIEKIISEMANEQCVKAEHSSGLKVYICEKKDLGTNYAVFGTHYGSIDTEFSVDTAPLITVPEGIAHFLEHKLFEGEDGDAFEKYAVTGASANAYTSFDRTCYLFSCSEKFYENLDILLGFVTSPYFTPETVAKEQGIIGQEIKMYEDVPGWRVLFNLFRIMYHNHPVKIEIAGTVDSIAKITDKTLYDCYKTFYNPSNMFLCLCGDFDTQKVLQTVDEKFTSTDTVKINRSTFSEPKSVVTDYTEQKMPVSMPLFVAGVKDNTDLCCHAVKQVITTELLLELSCGKISPLYNKLLNEGLINSGFSTEFFYGHGYGALLFEGESKEPSKIKDEIKAAINSIKNGQIDDSLFEDARRKLYGKEIRSFNEAEEIVDMFINCAIDNALPYERLETLKNVTKQDVIDRANELDLTNFALSVIKN